MNNHRQWEKLRKQVKSGTVDPSFVRREGIYEYVVLAEQIHGYRYEETYRRPIGSTEPFKLIKSESGSIEPKPVPSGPFVKDYQ